MRLLLLFLVSALSANAVTPLQIRRTSVIATTTPAVWPADNFTRANGALGVTSTGGYAWQGATWGIASNAATNAPAVGNELLANPGFEGTYVAGLAPNWSKNGSPTLTEEGTIKNGGAAAQKFVGSAGTDFVYKYPATPAVVSRGWMIFSGWIYHPTGDGGAVYMGTTTLTPTPIHTAAANSTWTNIIFTGRTNSNPAGPVFRQSGATAATAYFDDASVKELNLTNCIAYVSNLPSANVNASVSIVRGIQGFPCGVVANLDSSTYTNYLVAYYNGGSSAALDSCVNGAFTNLLSGAITYVDGAVLQIRTSPSTGVVALYYNGTQVSTNKTTGVWSGFTAYNAVGLFNTWTNSKITNFITAAYQ